MSEYKDIDQQALDLINGGIDAELSTTEQEKLARLLAESSEAREAHKELESFARIIDEIPDLDPPDYLHDSIQRQISLPAHSKAKADKHGLVERWLSANWLRTGFALAAGVVLTVGVYEMGSQPITTEDANNLVGTVVKSQAPGEGELLDSIQVISGTLNGQVEIRNEDDLFTLNVQMISDGPAELVVNFAGRGLEFEGIVQTQDIKGAISVMDGSINVASSGEQNYTVMLRRTGVTQEQATVPLRLEFFAGNALVYEAELRVFRQ